MSTISSLSNMLLPNNAGVGSTGSAIPTSSTSGSGTNSSSTSPYALTPQDFIKLMVTQLQNQDPTQPMTNEDLLQQMSQIGQLESTTTLQSSLTSMALQNQIGSAGNIIGKTVTGLDDAQNDVGGVVNAVQVQNSMVYLQLDTGATLQLANVTSISPTPTTPAATATTGS